MPWGYGDARRHTHKADTPKKQRQWASIADRVLSDSGDEAKAVRIANGVIKKHVVPRNAARKKS